MRSPEQGAARERTDLAWQRAAFAYTALGGVVLGVAAHRDAAWLLAVSAGLIAVAGGMWRQGRALYRRAGVTAQPRVLALLTAVTALTAVVAAVVVLVER
jgi:lysylphosphatidylglycerol synthetase-like protein (DUF2156 family)